MFNKKEYNAKYIDENTTGVSVRMLKREKKLLDEYLKAINAPVSTYIKALINADMAKHGYKAIFHDNRKIDSEPIFPEE